MNRPSEQDNTVKVHLTQYNNYSGFGWHTIEPNNRYYVGTLDNSVHVFQMLLIQATVFQFNKDQLDPMFVPLVGPLQVLQHQEWIPLLSSLKTNHSIDSATVSDETTEARKNLLRTRDHELLV